MKNVTKISIALVGVALIGVATFSSFAFQNSKTPTIDSLRVQTEEARLREEQARKDREAREDNLSKALYLECFHTETSGTGSRFDEQQRKAYDCWRTNTNGTGKLAPASEPPSRTIISNPPTNVTNQSTVRPDNERSSGNRSEVQQTPKTQGKGMAVSLQNRGQVPQSQGNNQARKNEPKGKEQIYWAAYETAIAQIHKWEGLRLSAYWDHNGYSIGYGSRANSSTEKISKAEADRRLTVLVKQLLAQVQKDFPNLHPEGQGALVSFAYNCHSGYQAVRKYGLSKHQYWCTTASGKKLPGLVSRRAEEAKLLFSK